jgi:acyl carrier protein
MESFLAKLAEILDEKSVSADEPLAAKPAWDSLAVLSIVALAQEDYGVVMHGTDVRSAATPRALLDLIEARRRRP